MSKKTTVLAVDDEVHILELIEYNLEQNRFHALTAESGEEALEIIEKQDVDLVLLDLMMDGMDGLEVLKKLRQSENTADLPVIILTAKGEEINKVLGLELGADDYISKPFGVHELIARIKAVLRRTKRQLVKKEDEQQITIGDMIINRRTREVKVGEESVHLSLKEFELLYLLASNRGQVFSRDQLLDTIWGYDYYGETRTVDVHVRNLRKKIEKDDTMPAYIKTVRGVGYKFV
ncbi:MAG: response regulator transcription factor [Lachnospiraceae bacterium]|nr:response regulator transcription factor [Lachnospiraceae bacterium]